MLAVALDGSGDSSILSPVAGSGVQCLVSDLVDVIGVESLKLLEQLTLFYLIKRIVEGEDLCLIGFRILLLQLVQVVCAGSFWRGSARAG